MINLRKPANRCLISEMPIGDPIRDHRHMDPLFTAPIAVQALVGGLAASTFAGMMADKPSQNASASAPTVSTPTAMPTPGDANTEAAKKKSLAEQLARRGRASTILTDSGATDTLGA